MHVFIALLVLLPGSVILNTGYLPPATSSCFTGVQQGIYTNREGNVLSYNWEENSADPSSPVLIVLHGGTWTSGSMNDPWLYFRDQYNETLLKNFNIAYINYSLFNSQNLANPYPKQRNDILDFINGVDTPENKICLLGLSSGAHLAAAAAQVPNSHIDCLISVSGVYDFNPSVVNEQTQVQFGDLSRTRLNVASIMNIYLNSAIDNETPSIIDTLPANYNTPTLLIHSLQDTVVDVDQSISYFNKVESETSAEVHLELLQPNTYPTPHIPDYLGSCSDQNPSALSSMVNQFLSDHMF